MLRLAYFFSQFPGLTTTFLQREVRAIRSQGLDILLAANRTPSQGEFHPEDTEFTRRTFYLTPVKPFSYLKANLKFLLKFTRPYLNCIRLALTLKDGFPRQRLRNLAQLAGAAVLAEHFLANRVIHVHVHFAFGAASVAIFLKALTGIPFSLTVHGSDVLLPRPLTEEKLKRANFIISNCHYHISNLKRRFPTLNKQRFYLVRIGLNLTQGPWSRIVPIKKDSVLHILNVARLEQVKAQDILIHACARLHQMGIRFHCRIVGDGPRKKELNKLIEELELENSIELLGMCFQDELIRLYDWSHVMVLSSLSEGTPMTVIEAMAKERPVIAPNITALPEMVIENKTGFLFKPKSAEDLANRLVRFSESPELINEMGSNGRKHSEALFDLTENAGRLISIFAKEVPGLDLGSMAEIKSE